MKNVKKVLVFVMAMVMMFSAFAITATASASSTITAPVFTDINSSSWYYQAVMYCANEGFMSGVGNYKFNPGGTVTRAMAVSVIYRLAGAPSVSGSSKFSDVESGKWYTKAVV